jgi:hypothetical protein
MNRHFVHIYATVRVKIAVDGCADHAAAIDAADNLLSEHKHRLFDRTFRDERALSAPTRPDVQLIYAEADDEATGYLVDEAGDDELANSRDYGPDGRTPLHQPAPADEPRVEPTGYEAPGDLPERFFNVRFYKEEITVDRYSIIVRANDAEEARQRVKAWSEGEIELTEEEEDSENYERQADTLACEFSSLEDADDPYAAVECDEDGQEIAKAA